MLRRLRGTTLAGHPDVALQRRHKPRRGVGRECHVTGRGGTSNESPGNSTGTVTSGAVTRASSMKRSPLSSNRWRLTRPIPTGQRVPQWTATAVRGRSNRNAAAAVVGSRWPLREGRTPAPDRQDREIELAGQVGHPREQVRVTGEIDALVPIEHITDRRRVRSERHPASVVGRVDGPNADPSDRQLVAGIDLVHLLEALGADQSPGVPRHDEGGRAVELPQAAEVQMVLVGVRHEHGVDRCDIEIRRLAATSHRTDAPDEERIEQELHVVELEPHRGVPEPAQPRHAPSARRNAVTNSSPWVSV